MEISVTAGAYCFPQSGSFAAPGLVWQEQVGTKPAMSAAAGSLRAAGFSGHPVCRDRFHILVNPIGTHLPVPHRMRMSAPEP
ncbi:MAG: hypothetical protein ACRDTG_10245 [Pseudonocardiaceae bacterium]